MSDTTTQQDVESAATFTNAVLAFKASLDTLPSRSRLTDDDAEALYTLAHRAMLQGHAEAALKHLTLLGLYRPADVKYLGALGKVLRQLSRHQEAMNVYAFLAVIDADDVEHNLNIAECLMLLRSYEEARDLTHLIIQACKEGSVGSNAAVLARAEAIAELMRSRDDHAH